MWQRTYRKRSVRTQQASQTFASVHFSKKGLVNGQEGSCSKCVLCPCEPCVCTGVSEPAWAGRDCFCIWPWQQPGRSGVHSPVMHFGVLGVGFWLFYSLQLLPDRGVPVVHFQQLFPINTFKMLCISSTLFIATLHSQSVTKTC